MVKILVLIICLSKSLSQVAVASNKEAGEIIIMPEYTLKNITVVFRSHVVGAAQLDLELSFHRNNGQKNKASHRKFP